MMARQMGLFERAQSAVLENRVVWGLLAIATVLTVRSVVKQARGVYTRYLHRTCLRMLSVVNVMF